MTFPTVQEPSSAVNDDVSELGSSTRSDSTGITNRVELLEVPAVDSGADSQDVEMRRTKKSLRQRLDIFGREGWIRNERVTTRMSVETKRGLVQSTQIN